MNTLSRIITGTILMFAGLILIGLSFFFHWAISIYGILLLILGIIIFFNKFEDKIEQIKSGKKIKGGKR